MIRRAVALILTLGLVAAPLAAEAQEARGHRIGFISSASSSAMAARASDRLPLVSYLREFADVGGLMTYGPNAADVHRRAASYVDKILKGARPADLPIEQPTKFDLVINLKTAKALGLTIPSSLLLRADEIIQ